MTGVFLVYRFRSYEGPQSHFVDAGWDTPNHRQPRAASLTPYIKIKGHSQLYIAAALATLYMVLGSPFLCRIC